MTEQFDNVSRRYRANAEALSERYLALRTEDIFGAALPWVEIPPGRVLDIGAGPGRDAVWFSKRGHTVCAVEPVRAFHSVLDGDVTYLADTLPHLVAVRGTFDLILISGVWQHVPPNDRKAALRRVAGLLNDDGRIVLSLRCGGRADPGFIFPVDEAEVQRLADRFDLTVAATVRKTSIQPHNCRDDVRWTWMLLTSPLGHS